MQYYGTRLSENISRREPEGYLLCLNVPVARSGTQDYLPEELGLDPNHYAYIHPSSVPEAEGGQGGDRKATLLPVQRPPEEVFAPEAMASFEGMPVTNDHPPDGVTAENIRSLQKGHAHNVRRGSGAESDLLLADLIITDPVLIEAILAGKREISCGYTYELHEENGQYIQRKIRGNHVAVVDAGRAGSRVSIKDEQPSGSLIRVTDAMLQPPVLQHGVRRSHRKPERSLNQMKKIPMKKSLLKKLTLMARDGDPEAIEALAEAVEEIIETPETAVAAAVIETEPAAPAGAQSAEEKITTTDDDTLAAILERLDRLIALLSPAAADDEPQALPEELAEVVEEAMEAVSGGLTPAGETAPVLPERYEKILEQVIAGEPSTVLSPEDPAEDSDDPDILCSEDELRRSLTSVRPALIRMNGNDRRLVCADLAAGLARRRNGNSRRYARLMDARRPAADYADLGKRIMAKRNPHFKG